MIALASAIELGACADERELTGPCDDCTVSVHPPGILDVESPAFHGKELARRGWDFTVCANCHGDDFRGGKVKGAGDCTTCHSEGPTACVTCHGDGPQTSAHPLHRAADVACAECHVVPTRWDDPGHILGDVAPAEVVLAGRAALTPVPGDRLGPPSYTDGRCTNVYCHGATLHAGGTATAPRWNASSPEPACARCHGAPPPSHAPVSGGGCAICHPASSPHVDGVVQLGTTNGCDGCHGRNGDPAPPRDLSGETSPSSLGVGAHQAHLGAPSGLRSPIACETCHAVPASVDAPGHIDTALPAEVSPVLGWDRASGTCATAWCHGPARPVWTETGGAACGSCHGVPPATPSHNPSMDLGTCGSCHPFPSLTDHIDGDLDVL
jgi:predicted CxxxxCH...CXXCH cytochrome family protein